MAARIDRIHSERVRARIRLSRLVSRVQDFAMGIHGVEMTREQLDAAKHLINKAMGNPPERKELSGPDGAAIPTSIDVRFVE